MNSSSQANQMNVLRKLENCTACSITIEQLVLDTAQKIHYAKFAPIDESRHFRDGSSQASQQKL